MNVESLNYRNKYKWIPIVANTVLIFVIFLFLVTPAFASVPRINQNLSAAINAAPDAPMLVSPADGETNVSTSPTLSVSVNDPESDNLTVTFYGRDTSGGSAPDFTLVELPDTQKYTINGLGIFGIQTQWIVDQRATQNIAFVTHVGDLVDDWNVSNQWNVANIAMSKLEPPGIPFGISPGNTDEDHYGVPPDTTYFNTYFPEARFAGRPYYGDAYNGDNANSYQLFSASGMDFIVIHLKYNLSYDPVQGQAILDWADALLKTYSDRRAIVVTHFLLNTSDAFSNDGNMIYTELKDNPNLFLMLGGHLDTEGRRIDLGTDGHTIYSLRSDYQTRANGGNGWLRILRFSPDADKIFVSTYSPYLNQYETDADSQFTLDYVMEPVSTFQALGSVTVPSGSTASLDWMNLTSDRQYEWYVIVDDGASTVTSQTWTFTTTSTPSSTFTPTTIPTFFPTNTATVTPTATAVFTPPTNTPTSAPTDTYTSQPDGITGMDTYMQQNNPTANQGSVGYMQIGESNYGTSLVSRGLIKFDLSSIPANAQVTNAVLSLWGYGYNGTNDTAIQVYRVLQPWSENTVTWNLYDTGLTWQVGGASGASDYDAANLLGSVLIPSSTGSWGTRFDINLSAVEVTKIINGTYTNCGWVLRTASELDDQRVVHTSDSTSTSYRPELVVNYAMPMNTPTNTATFTPTATNTATFTSTNTATNTPVPPTATYTPTNTATFTPTATNSATFTPTNTATLIPTATFTLIPTPIRVNLALNKPVLVSSFDGSSNVGEFAVDDNLLTSWHTAKSVGKNRLPSEYIVVDLQGEYPIDQVTLNWDSNYATDYTVSVSTDYITWSTVVSVTGQDGANDTHNFAPVMARYVYLNTTAWSSTTWRNWLYEFGIFGSEPGFPTPIATFTSSPTPTTGLSPTPTTGPSPTPTATATFTSSPTSTTGPSLTPTAGPFPTTMPTSTATFTPSVNNTHIGDLDGFQLKNGGTWQAQAWITVHAADELPVSDATVNLHWSGGFTGIAYCVTDFNGTCFVTSGSVSKNISSIAINVDSVSHATLVYSPSNNHDPDGDSNGTTLVILK